MRIMGAYSRQHYANRYPVVQPGGGSHLHAEMYAVLHYLRLRQDPGEHIAAIGVSKRICPMCAAVLDYLGIQYTAGWVTDVTSNHWVNPWTMLPKGCKPAVPPWRPDGESDDESDGGGDGRGSGPGGGGGRGRGGGLTA